MTSSSPFTLLKPQEHLHKFFFKRNEEENKNVPNKLLYRMLKGNFF